MENYTLNDIVLMDVGHELANEYINIDYLERFLKDPRSFDDPKEQDLLFLDFKDEDVLMKDVKTDYELLLGNSEDGYDTVNITDVPAIILKDETIGVPYIAYYAMGFVQATPYSKHMIKDGMPLEVLEQVTLDSVWELVVSRHLASLEDGLNMTIPYPRRDDGKLVVDASYNYRNEDGELFSMDITGIPLLEREIDVEWTDDYEEAYEDDEVYDEDDEYYDDLEAMMDDWEDEDFMEPLGLIYNKYTVFAGSSDEYTFSIRDKTEDLNGFVMSAMEDDTLGVIGNIIVEFEDICNERRMEPSQHLIVDLDTYLKARIKNYHQAKVEEYDENN